MPVSATNPSLTVDSHGNNTYPFPFRLLEPGDLLVTVDGVAKTLGVDYSVIITAEPGEGGSVVFQPEAKPAAGSGPVKVSRKTSVDRSTDYQESGGFRQAVVDKDFDRLVMMLQETDQEIDYIKELSPLLQEGQERIIELEAAAATSAQTATEAADLALYYNGMGQIAAAQALLAVKTHQVATYAALRALDVAALANGFLVTVAGRAAVNDGGGGIFRWDTSNLAAKVAADAVSDVYVAPDSAPTGAAGAWVRQNIVAQQNQANSASYRMGLRYGKMDATVRGSYLFDGRSGYPNFLGVNNVAPVEGGREADTGYVNGAADVAAVLAGYDNIANGLAGIVASQHSIIYATATHGSIFGGSLHAIKPGADYATIVGGTNNTIEDLGDYSVIIGGTANKMEAGADITTSGFKAAIIASDTCTVSGRNSIILGSLNSRIDSTYGTIFAGESVTLTNGSHMGAGGNSIAMGAAAAAPFSFAWGNDIQIDAGRATAFGDGHRIATGHEYTSARGYRCVTPGYSSHVFSGRHRGGVAGRNQALSFTCSNETTDAVTVRLSLAGATNYPKQPDDSIVNGTFHVTGVNTANGEVATYEIAVSSKRVGNGASAIAYQNTVTRVNGLGVVTAPVISVAAGGIYRVEVVGVLGKTIAWDAVFHGQQVVWTP